MRVRLGYMLTLATPVDKLNKIGTVTAKKLQRLGITTAEGLLCHYPFRYEDYSRSVSIKDLCAGMRVNVRGVIEFIHTKRTARQRMLITEMLINDTTGQLKVIWFNQPFISRTLEVGERVSLAGLVEEDVTGLVMRSPEYEKSSTAIHTVGIVPVYRTTGDLTNKQLRYLIHSALPAAALVVDPLPETIRAEHGLMGLPQAISIVHNPSSMADVERVQRRLKFDELFYIQLTAQVSKAQAHQQPAPALRFFEEETRQFVGRLPFELTAAQKKAAWEIIGDIQKATPMARLLEGDVGSGKTVTVAVVMRNVTLNKKQSALLVPTEILASQHYETLCRLFCDSDVRIGLYTRSMWKINNEAGIITSGGGVRKKKKKTKKELCKEILWHSDIIVGTHALIQESVVFRDLALVVIDEQHRFGVEQRKSLRQKSGQDYMPHLLSMTATPIPRTLAQAFYGDLDLSIINQMPKGRKPIQSFLVPAHKRHDAYNFIRTEIVNGRQAFVVCPLISESDKLGVASVEQEYKKLHEHVFPDLRIAYLHGRLKSAEKEVIMRQFLGKEIDILVSTAVIEVGVDVPNATIMIIEAAERFGLAQLHQFRGRVGRSDLQSYCLLFTESLNAQTRQRLELFSKTADGFKLAEADLNMRGPGEVYGSAQKGFPELTLATLDDYPLIQAAKSAAERIVKEGIERYPLLASRIRQGGEWVVG